MILRPLSDDERRDWLRLSLSENIGPITFHALLRRHGSAAEAIAALPELSAKGGLKRSLRVHGRDATQRHIDEAEAMGARFVGFCEPDYPTLLRMIDAAPPLLCMKGDATLASKTAAGIVGARNASAAGRKLARQLAHEIGSAGHTVVSGLARGIDTAAHEASLETGTVAVVAGGIDVIYPPENDGLQHAIGERGLIVSEMVPGTLPREKHFPRRNRIISGIAKVTIIVEAALRSGSLITARYASEQGREVLAVPGSPLDPRCEGCNRLIRDGATMLLGANDALDALASGSALAHGRLFEPPRPDIEVADTSDNDRERFLDLLSPTPVDMDDLIRESGLPPAVATGLVLELEIAGRVSRVAGGMICRTG